MDLLWEGRTSCAGEKNTCAFKRRWQLNFIFPVLLSPIPVRTPRAVGLTALKQAEMPSSKLVPSSSPPALPLPGAARQPLAPSSAPTHPAQLRSQRLNIFSCCCSSTCLKLKKSSAKRFFPAATSFPYLFSTTTLALGETVRMINKISTPDKKTTPFKAWIYFNQKSSSWQNSPYLYDL